MAAFTWNSQSSQDPLIAANWLKSDGTSNTMPGASDDIYFLSVPGVTLANVWASGGVGSAMAAPTTSGASSTGGNLAFNTNYFYYVTALLSNGETPVSAELSYTTPNNAVNTNQITLNWSAVSGASGYKVYRGTSSGGELYLASPGNVTSYADTSATVPAGKPPGIITFNSINFSQGFTGTIGNSGQNGYWVIGGATTWQIGIPVSGNALASGSGRIKINFGSTAFTGTVLNTGQSIDVGQDPVRILGTSSSNVLSVLGGKGVSVANNQPGETSNISGALNVAGNGVTCTMSGGVTWNNANVSGGATLTINSAASGSTPQLNVSSGSQAITYGTGAIATITNGGTVKSNSTGTVTTWNNLPSAIADFSGSAIARAVTTMNSYPNSKIQRYASGGSYLTISTHNKLGITTESYT